MANPSIMSVSILCSILFLYQLSEIDDVRSWVVNPVALRVEPNFHLRSEPAPDDWWTNRFMSQEIMEMSALGRRLFVYENLPTNEEVNNKKFKILVWRFHSWAKRKYVRSFTSKDKDVFANCSVKNCDFIYEDSKILQADAVLFYLHKMILNFNHVQDMEKLPRKPDQRWVYLSDESPWNSPIYAEYEGVFNWTMTYHTQSDVPVPYGRIARRQERDDSIVGNIYHSKPLLVATMQSNCGGQSGRFNYIDHLVKHVQVDVWGACGRRYNQSHACTKGRANACPSLDQYKFYIAFENSLCSEYLSEKVWWNAIGRNSVPVVMGGKSQRDYTKLLPLKSYINVDDFESPKDLADYLKFLGDNPTEYNKYHDWRKEYQALQEHGYYGTQARHYCRLCEALNYNSKDPKTIESLNDFWGKDHCRKGLSHKLKFEYNYTV